MSRVLIVLLEPVGQHEAPVSNTSAAFGLEAKAKSYRREREER